MIRLRFLLVALCLLSFFAFPVLAGEDAESTVRSYDDYVKIKLIPAQSEFMKQEPVRELVARSYTTEVKETGEVMSTNDAIKRLHEDVAALNAQGLDPVVPFHQKYWELEISYKGNVVKTSYSGPLDYQGNEDFVARWLPLYRRSYEFVVRDVVP